MARHRRRRDDEERERSTAAAPRARVGQRGGGSSPGEPAATVLDLQARAGNRAVTGLLEGSGPTVLREAVQRAGPRRKRPARTPAQGAATLVVPDLEATIALRSVVLPEPRRGGSGTRGPSHTHLHVVTAPGPSSPVLFQAAAAGRHFDRMVVVLPSLRLVLANVFVATFTPSEAGDAVTLDSTSLATVPD